MNFEERMKLDDLSDELYQEKIKANKKNKKKGFNRIITVPIDKLSDKEFFWQCEHNHDAFAERLRLDMINEDLKNKR